ncbi:MAG: hypothetical protein AB3N16_06430, partial [Flavobacteriaceae bacterium]
IDFVSSGTHPETNGSKLTDVIIKEVGGSENKRYTLIYETTDRLWLDKVQEIAGTSTNTYELTYFEKNLLPAFNSGSDVWGYNDGNLTSGTACTTLSNFDTDAIKRGVLTSIEYPTGGKKEFVFEHHDFSREGDTLLSSDEFFKLNPLNQDNQNIVFNYDIDNINNTTTLSPFTIDFEQYVSFKNNITTANSLGEEVCRMVITDSNDNLLYLFDLDSPSCQSLLLSPGDYKFGVEVIDLNVNPYNAEGQALLYYTSEITGIIQQKALGGGLRIKEIAFNDLSSPTIHERKIFYDYSEEGYPTRSSGSVDTKIGLLNEYEFTTTKYLFGGTTNVAGAFSGKNVTYKVGSKGNYAQLTNGGYVGYKTVTVSEAGNGKEVYSFTSPQDFPSPTSAITYPFAPLPNLDYKRGLLLKHSTYNQAGNILKETENTLYAYAEDLLAPSLKTYDPQQCEWRQFYSAYVFYDNNNENQNIADCGGTPCLVNYYDCGGPPMFVLQDNLESGWAQLKEKYIRNYFYDASLNQTVVEKRQTFDYNTTNFQPNIEHLFVKDNGVEKDYLTETFFAVGGYPTDYEGLATDVSQMETLNMINVPIYIRNSLDGNKIGTTQHVYSQFHTNRIDLSSTWTEKDGNNSDLEKRIEFHDYDNHGNPLEVSLANGSKTSYIWGYNQTVPVAKVENATRLDIEALSGFGANFHAGTANLSVGDENTLRSGLPNAMITTIEYEPLIGPTKITDPRDYSTSFTYDEFNRLLQIKDDDLNLISDYKYHYKGQ